MVQHHAWSCSLNPVQFSVARQMAPPGSRDSSKFAMPPNLLKKATVSKFPFSSTVQNRTFFHPLTLQPRYNDSCWTTVFSNCKWSTSPWVWSCEQCATYVFGKHITVKTLITSLLLLLMGLTNFDCLPCVLCFRICLMFLTPASAIYQTLCTADNFTHIVSSPHYPQNKGFDKVMVRTAKSLLPKIPSNQYLALLTYLCVPMLWCGRSPSEQSIETQLSQTYPNIQVWPLNCHTSQPIKKDQLMQQEKTNYNNHLSLTSTTSCRRQSCLGLYNRPCGPWLHCMACRDSVVVNHPNPIHDAYTQPVSSDKTSWNVSKAEWNHNYQHWQWWLVADQGGSRGTKELPFGKMWKIVLFKLLVNLKLCSCIF